MKGVFVEVIFILIIISLAVAAIFLIAFFWAVSNGQFDDNETPPLKILFQDDVRKRRRTSNIERK